MVAWLQQVPLLHALLLVVVCWLAYWDILKGQWVSDDWEGIANYDGKFKRIGAPTPPGGQPISAMAPPAGGSLWNDGLTWLRWHIGKAPNPNYRKLLDPNKPDGPRDERQFVAHPLRHHRLNLILFSAISLLVWSFLSTIVGEPIAFLATLLWIVHPVGVQCVGWISGIGYVLAAFFMLLGLNAAVLLSHTTLFANPFYTLLIAGVYFLCQFLAFRSQFTSIAVVAILVFLHLWLFAAIAGLVSALGLLHTFMTVVSVRADTFKKQQMGASATLHPKKLVVVGKTFYYYLKLVLFPKRLGLYHTFGYHYPLPWIEWEDRYFWAGAGLALGLLGLACVAPAPIPFAIVWWFAFTVFVLNWITVHQFVAERYMWIPSIAVCLLVATYAPAWLFWAYFGVLLMRTWAHLPTYFNELMFYQSNVWNHPTSEVAYGNLGVTFLRMHLAGSAVDQWTIGGQLNPEYDVNWYNLYSIYRSQRLFDQARTFLLRALSTPTCHFPKEWRDELNILEMEMSWQQALAPIPDAQKDAWQKVQLESLLQRTDVPYRSWWEEKQRQFIAYCKEKRPELLVQPSGGPPCQVST